MKAKKWVNNEEGPKEIFLPYWEGGGSRGLRTSNPEHRVGGGRVPPEAEKNFQIYFIYSILRPL